MKTALWEIAIICLTTAIGALAYVCRKPPKSLSGVSEEDMMRAIANHALLQQYFNQGDEISEVEILETVYSPDKKGVLIQVLCNRLADGNKTIRLYFASVNDSEYSPRILAESTRSLDWGQRLAFYNELKPLEVAIYSGYWVEATYQQLALNSFDGITINYKRENRVVKFALPMKQQATILVVPASHLNN